jgi:uncharacterized repeat protein (TIGR03843 family)
VSGSEGAAARRPEGPEAASIGAPAGEPDPAPPAPDLDAALALIRDGVLDIEGRLVDASNATLYCTVSLDGLSAPCVYKPVRGERPLWDFPDGTLAARETAAYLVSVATGWNVVPPTVLRDGPFGDGMVQLWVDGEEGVDLGRLIRSDSQPLRRMAVYDVVINNADRKGGHLIPMPDGHVYGVDHGVSFHRQDKLRTVLWSWAGDRLPDDAVDTLCELRAELEGPLAEALHALLTRREVAATVRRVDRLVESRQFPRPSGEWPAVPWPPF